MREAVPPFFIRLGDVNIITPKHNCTFKLLVILQYIALVVI